MVRSTVCIDRALAQQADQWAERRGLPSGPGRRTKAVEALIRAGLERPSTITECPDCNNGVFGAAGKCPDCGRTLSPILVEGRRVQ